jgi:hypothetical protein
MPVRFYTRQILGALFLLAAIGVASPLWAQKDAGAIVGLVRDGRDRCHDGRTKGLRPLGARGKAERNN